MMMMMIMMTMGLIIECNYSCKFSVLFHQNYSCLIYLIPSLVQTMQASANPITYRLHYLDPPRVIPDPIKENLSAAKCKQSGAIRRPATYLRNIDRSYDITKTDWGQVQVHLNIYR